jgi:hypothetical protein
MTDGTQARSAHTEDLLPQETDEYHFDRVRAEAPGELVPGGSRSGDDPVVFPFSAKLAHALLYCLQLLFGPLPTLFLAIKIEIFLF